MQSVCIFKISQRPTSNPKSRNSIWKLPNERESIDAFVFAFTIAII